MSLVLSTGMPSPREMSDDWELGRYKKRKRIRLFESKMFRRRLLKSAVSPEDVRGRALAPPAARTGARSLGQQAESMRGRPETELAGQGGRVVEEQRWETGQRWPGVLPAEPRSRGDALPQQEALAERGCGLGWCVWSVAAGRAALGPVGLGWRLREQEKHEQTFPAAPRGEEEVLRFFSNSQLDAAFTFFYWLIHL